eukprot:g5669.t1
MRERPRPEPPSPPPSCFCLTRSKRCVALGVAAALAAAGTLKWTLPSNRHSPSPLAPGGGDATKASPGVSSPAVDDKGVEGPGGKQGGGESGAGAQSSLPRCFSSPEADPSDGAWRKTDHGVCDSPAHLAAGWSLPTHQFDFLRRCDETWNDQDHPGPKVPRPYWEWEPAKCSLEAVDEAKFCRVMKGRKGVLLVGDSLTRLMTTTLATVLRADGVSTDTFKDNWQACGGDLKVRFMRNDYLDTRTAPRYKSLLCEQGVGGGPQAENTRCRIFATDETLGEFDTLVVNSGAHPRGAPEYGRQMDAAAEALTEAMHRLHGRDRAVLVVRNTAPGHWGCTERMFDGPVDEALAEELVNNAPEKYQWGTFHDRNAQLEEAFSAEKGWRLLDAYTPTLLRADSHIGGPDCLHFCVPGPADHWVTLLYNVLLDATGGTE